MLRLLVALAVLLLPAPADAAALTRWTSSPLAGAHRLVSGGPVGATALVVIRAGMDPLRSFDGGETWTSFTIRGERPADLTIAPSDSRFWYAVTPIDPITRKGSWRVWRTRDGGTTWEQRSTVVNRYEAAPEISADPDLLYLLREEQVDCGFLCPGPSVNLATSRDGGLTWANENPAINISTVLASPVDSRVAMANSFMGGEGGTVFRTEDAGRTWRALTLPAPPPNLPFVRVGGGEIALDQRDPLIAYVRPARTSAAADEIYSTRDGGRTWARASIPEGQLSPDPSEAGRVYLFAHDGRVMESRDAGANWVLVDVGSGAPTYGYPETATSTTVMLHLGRRTAVFAYADEVARLDLTNGPVALGSDLWWNPARSGEGFTITQHASNGMFVVWYTYDATGKPVWRVMPGGTWHDRIITGTLYETEGPPYFQGGTFDPSRVASRAVGVATIDFRDQDNATVTFGNGSGTVHSRTAITRQLFGDPATYAGESFADLWWNDSESGWGIGINHQGNRVFATWYVYGEDGKPLWVVMPDAVIADEFVGAVLRPAARGDIYTTRGPAGQVAATRVGTARLLFRGSNSAELEYTAFGRTEARAITRQPF